MMRFFVWKTLTRCAALLVVSIVFLTSGHAVFAATTHGTSVVSHPVTAHQNVVANVVHLNNTSSYYGCPLYYACIEATGEDTDLYYTYGIHSLVNEFGVHRVVNNQYVSQGNTFVTLCKGYYTGCDQEIVDQGYLDIDLTPYNYIVLSTSTVGF